MEEEVKDKICGHAKPMDKKKKIVIITATACALLAVILGFLIWGLTFKAGGLVDRKVICVEDSTLFNGDSITIPVKMKNGFSTPTHQKFHSDLTILQLCELAKDYDSNQNYEIHNNKAYLYKVKSDKVIARAVLSKHDAIYDNLNYTLQHLSVEGIVFPIHLTEKFFNEEITFSDTIYRWYAISFMTVDELVNWLDSTGLYKLEINAQKDTVIVTDIEKDSPKVQIYFNGNIIAVKAIYN